MNDVNIGKDSSRHSFVFTGKGDKYFLICPVNSLLTTITLGVYGSWALIKYRCYTYQHMTLRGRPFNYKGTGGTVFVSVSLIAMVYLPNVSCFAGQRFTLDLFLFALLIYGTPCMAVKSLQYQASMTSPNDARFSLNCSTMRTQWVMLGPSVLLALVF